ncbi:unnamed protein product [Trifolium pratense]|uniref:Uncharacterized protein n=1 Tax=Trifolium pratense TaxID=57577 RepID=A0ACB0LBQ0_TRIPR|nr:unnamed protein product [Trifolium pratense]
MTNVEVLVFFFFGCVLLRDEKIPSFTRALKGFLAFVKGKYPQTILTDQDLALKEVIALILHMAYCCKIVKLVFFSIGFEI